MKHTKINNTAVKFNTVKIPMSYKLTLQQHANSMDCF